jgi:hypothetical protein
MQENQIVQAITHAAITFHQSEILAICPLPQRLGCKPEAVVIRTVSYGLHPIVVHYAAISENKPADEAVGFYQGSYFHEGEMREALAEFTSRASRRF